MSGLASAIYEGRILHVRHGPRPHRFEYDVQLFYLDLDEIDRLPLHRAVWRRGRFGLFSFARRDYLAHPDRTLKDSVLDRVEARLGRRPSGPVRMLGHVRWLGSVFNPVTFWYCFAADGETLEAIVAEITNTPWRERHVYVIAADGRRAHGEFDKEFHVSPFFDLAQRYRWDASVPGRTIDFAMSNSESGVEVFHARLALERRELSTSRVLRMALRRPLGARHVLGAIWWQALRLWWKRTPSFRHPARRAAAWVGR